MTANKMREIKFRAWDKVEKEWNTTFYVDSKGLVYKSARDLEDGINTFDLELLQFTGLKDKNGKEICEGYIVKLKDAYVCAVEFAEGAFGVRHHESYWISFSEHEREHSDYIRDWEIIGNIYSNPELLK